MHPVVHTVLLTFYIKGDIRIVQYIASAALVGFWKGLASVPVQFISTLFLHFVLLHKIGLVASILCQNAYITDQHGEYECPSL